MNSLDADPQIMVKETVALCIEPDWRHSNTGTCQHTLGSVSPQMCANVYINGHISSVIQTSITLNIETEPRGIE
jgi:hypothetical protein